MYKIQPAPVPKDYNVTIDVTGLNLPEHLKFNIMNAIANKLDFALVGEDNQAAMFIENRVMVTREKDALSFTALPDQKALFNAIGVCTVFYREFKLLNKLLTSDEVVNLKLLGEVKGFGLSPNQST